MTGWLRKIKFVIPWGSNRDSSGLAALITLRRLPVFVCCGRLDQITEESF